MNSFEDLISYLEKTGTPKSDGYSYQGYFVTLDRMGGMTTFVNVRRGPYDEDVVASATIEDGRVELKRDSGGMTPTMDKMRYRGPESVLDALLSMDESKSMSRKSTMKISERKLKKIIREETKKAINEIDLSKEFKTIGKFMEDVSMSYGSVRPIGEKTERGEKVYEFEINGAIFQIKPLT
jgi:hypothetical protein